MSLVQIISANEFIGDSLGKINNNFSNLNSALHALSSGMVSDNGSVSSVYVTKEEYQRIDTMIATTEDVIERFLTPSLCDVRVSCSSAVHYTYDEISTNKLYLHPYNGNYISLYDKVNTSWFMYELTDVKGYNLYNSESFTGRSPLTPNSLCGVFVYLDADVLKLYFKQTFTSVSNLIRDNITYIDNVPVYTKDYNKRFLGLVRIDSNSKCSISQSNLSLFNFNSIETLTHSNSSISFTVFKDIKLVYNTVVPVGSAGKFMFRDVDRRTTSIVEVENTDYFNNVVVDLQPGAYTLTLSTTPQTQETLITATLKS